MPLVRSIALAAFVALTSCTAPTVLRPVPEEAVEPGRTFAPSPASPIREELAGPERRAAQTASLSLEEKESLFRDFDDSPAGRATTPTRRLGGFNIVATAASYLSPTVRPASVAADARG